MEPNINRLQQNKWRQKVNRWKNSRSVRVLLFFSFIVLYYLSVSPKLIQETYDIKLNGISSKSILAPRMIENKAATLRAQADASEDVQPVQTVIQLRNEEIVELVFNKIEQLNPDTLMSNDDKIAIYRSEFPQLFKDYTDRYIRDNRDLYKEAMLEEIQAQMADYEYRIPEETYFKIPKISAQEISEMKFVTKSIVTKLMLERNNDPLASRTKVPEMVNASQLSNKNAREIVQEIARFALTSNRFYDEEATKEARIQAAEMTEAIYVQKGDVLVAKGQRITAENYDLLQDLDVLKNSTNLWPHLGMLIMVSLFVFVLYMFIRQSQLAIMANNVHLLMLLLIHILTIISIVIISLGQDADVPYIGYMAPVALGSILITILLDAQIAFISSMIFSILASIILNVRNDLIFDYRYGFVAAVVCMVSIFAIHKVSQRSTILRAGILICAFATISSISFILIENSYSLKNVLYSIAFSTTGGMITAVLVIGLLPFFEIAFGILSPLKLVELSNPNHPLLRKLLTETPGTYHHSVMVGNLSESAAEAIGADGLLCRVGSFYHDIGKTKRPSYFIENQTNIENPHDQMDPSLSKSIIIAHARDGVDMLLNHRMPKPLRDIAEQHHGTSLLVFFYHKAMKQLEQDGDTETVIDEAEYRYPGPKAQTREAAIVGIADSIEAAVRSMRNPTKEQIDTMIRKIIKARLDDGQFDECDLTMKELDLVARSLKETLLGIFHSRIEYPEDLPNQSISHKDKRGAQV
ncbi:MAG: HDIG domain-containing metalloprotein [Paenibacillaceae bacterium]